VGSRPILIACVDGLTGFPDAIESVYLKAKIQLCIVHMMRNSLNFVAWKDRKIVVADLKRIYRSTTVDDAEAELEAFCEKWDNKFPSIGRMRRRHWPNLITIFDYPPEIRKIIYTTNAIESLNNMIRSSYLLSVGTMKVLQDHYGIISSSRPCCGVRYVEIPDRLGARDNRASNLIDNLLGTRQLFDIARTSRPVLEPNTDTATAFQRHARERCIHDALTADRGH